jgi:hypothetical protein
MPREWFLRQCCFGALFIALSLSSSHKRSQSWRFSLMLLSVEEHGLAGLNGLAINI